MKLKSVVSSVLISFILGLVPTISAANSVPDEQYSSHSFNTPKDKIGIFFEEPYGTSLRFPSMLYAQSFSNGGTDTGPFCDGLDDPACAGVDQLYYYALMPPCKSAVQVDCIESIYAIASGTTDRINGIYKESIPDKVDHPFKADPARGLPEGSVSGIWQIPNIKHGGGSTDFAAIVSRFGLIRKGNPLFPGTADFRAAIFPVNIIRDSRYLGTYLEFDTRGGRSRLGFRSGFQPNGFDDTACAIVANGICALRQSFPNDVQFGTVIRFSKVFSGWMHGRIDAPEIDYQLTDYGTRVDIKGLSTRVPKVDGYTEPDNLTKKGVDIKDYILGGKIGSNIGSDSSIDDLNYWAEALNNKAVANPTEWNFFSLPEYQMQTANRCVKTHKTLAGFVTTNSTAYSAGPPTFNEETQSLDYKVASLHLTSDGKVFQGKYNLYIDSKVARCIYGFSNAPISATVTIVSNNLEQTFKTASLQENNGWIHLSVNGFTFSSPTIKVRLKQVKPEVKIPTPTPTPTPTPAPSATATKQALAKPKKVVATKKTITCIKGKLTKKVTGLAPKCPSGYKISPVVPVQAATTPAVASMPAPISCIAECTIYEGQSLTITAPRGKLIERMIGWYGNPSDRNQGALVSTELTKLFFDKKTATVTASNALTTDPAFGVTKVLIFSVTYKDE